MEPKIQLRALENQEPYSKTEKAQLPNTLYLGSFLQICNSGIYYFWFPPVHKHFYILYIKNSLTVYLSGQSYCPDFYSVATQAFTMVSPLFVRTQTFLWAHDSHCPSCGLLFNKDTKNGPLCLANEKKVCEFILTKKMGQKQQKRIRRKTYRQMRTERERERKERERYSHGKKE